MASESNTTTDVYKIETDQAQVALLALVEAAKKFTGELKVQVESATDVRHEVQRLAAASEEERQAAQAVASALHRQSQSMKEVERNTKEAAQASKGMADILANDLEGKMFSAAARVQLLYAAFNLLKEAVVGGVIAAAEQARADNRLAAAARQMGLDVERTTATLKLQAGELEELTLVQGESIQQIQALLLRYGQAPEKVGATTQAIIDFAAVTGKDATSAAQTLMRAIEGDGEELRSLGVTVERTGDKMKDLDSVTEAISNRFGGEAKAQVEGFAGSVGRLSKAWEDTWKNIGKAIGDTGLIDKAAHNWAAFASIFADTSAEVTEKYRHKEIQHWREQWEIAAADVSRTMSKLYAAEAKGDEGAVRGLSSMLELYQKEADELARRIKAAGGDAPGLFLEKEVIFEEGENAGETIVAGVKKGIENSDKRDTAALLAKAFAANFEELQKEAAELSEFLERVDKSIGDRAVHQLEIGEGVRKSMGDQLDRQLTKRKAWSEADLAVLNAHSEEVRKASERELEALKLQQQKIEEFTSFAKDAAEQLLNVGLDAVREHLTANADFTAEYEEASVRRRQAELAELGIQKSAVDVRKDLAAEERANLQAKLADVLASIAQQAAVKAIFATAEGFAHLAYGNVPSATAAFTAAAAYATTATLAGGGAYALAQTRGRTTEERQTLEDMARQEKDRKKREAKQESQVRGGRGDEFTQHVYFMGITGYTETAQAAELERIRRGYSNLRTGSGG